MALLAMNRRGVMRGKDDRTQEKGRSQHADPLRITQLLDPQELFDRLRLASREGGDGGDLVHGGAADAFH